MKKELIICIVVLVCVIVGNIITQNYTKECAMTMEEKLSNLKDVISQHEKQGKQIEDKIKKIKEDWDGMQEKLAFYIEHDELEKVETQLALLEGEIEVENYQDTSPEIEKCIFILEHIVDKTALNVKNIF